MADRAAQVLATNNFHFIKKKSIDGTWKLPLLTNHQKQVLPRRVLC